MISRSLHRVGSSTVVSHTDAFRDSKPTTIQSCIPLDMKAKKWLVSDVLSSFNPVIYTQHNNFSTTDTAQKPRPSQSPTKPTGSNPFSNNTTAPGSNNPFAAKPTASGNNPFAAKPVGSGNNPFASNSFSNAANRTPPVNPFAKKPAAGPGDAPNNPFGVPPTVNGYGFIHPQKNPFESSSTISNPFSDGGKLKSAFSQESLADRIMVQGQTQSPFAPRRVSTTVIEESLSKDARPANVKGAVNPFALDDDADLSTAIPEQLVNPFVVRRLVVPYSPPTSITNQTNPFLQGVTDQQSIFERARKLSEEKGSVYAGATPMASPRGSGRDLITALRQNIQKKAEQARLEASLSSSVTDTTGVFDSSFLGVLRQMNRRSKKTTRDLFESATFGASPETLAIREERRQVQADHQATLERAAVVSDIHSDLQQIERRILREAKTKKVVPVYSAQTIRAFSKALGLHMNRVIEGLVDLIQSDYRAAGNHKLVNPAEFSPNYMLNQEQAEGIAILHSIEPMVYNSTSPDEVAALLELIDSDAKSQLPSRAPVVTIMGHVDHGKTTLLDAYRKTSIADAEAGRITQSIGSFSVEVDSSLHDFVPSVTFLDTPGHAIFAKMREKGTKNGLTDIVILVLSAADSVQPQTREVVQLAKEAGRPIIVAVTKCDLDGVDPDHVRQELAEELDVVCEQLGGDVPSVNVSAKTGEGLVELLEAIALQANAMELKFRPRVDVAQERVNDWIQLQDAFSKGEGLLEVRAKQEIEALRIAAEEVDDSHLLSLSHPDYKVEKELLREQRLERMKEILKSNELSHLADFALGYAYVVETQVQRGAGVLVNAVVRQGEVRVGDHIVCGTQHATVRSLIDHNGASVNSVTAHKSSPVQILGIPSYDGLGDDIIIVPHERMSTHLTEARAKDESRKQAISDINTTDKSDNRPNVEREYIDRGRRSRALQFQETDAQRLDTERDVDSTLRVVVKSDVNGSLEAIQGYIQDLALSPHSELARVVVVKAGLGDITEQDIDFAQARGAIVVGFNVKMANRVSQYAREVNVVAETSTVIFRTFDLIRDTVSKLLPRKALYDVQGAAVVEALFNLNFTKVNLKKLAHSRADLDGNPMEIEPKCIVAGARVVAGELLSNQDFQWRILRDGVSVHEDLALAQLRHFKDEVQSVLKGKDCGILLAKSSLVEAGDTIECYKLRNESVVYNDTAARGHKEDAEYDYNATLKYNSTYELVTVDSLKEARKNI